VLNKSVNHESNETRFANIRIKSGHVVIENQRLTRGCITGTVIYIT